MKRFISLRMKITSKLMAGKENSISRKEGRIIKKTS